MKLRLGPLGTPLTIVLVWVVARVVMLAPSPQPVTGRRPLPRMIAGSSSAIRPQARVVMDAPHPLPAVRRAARAGAFSTHPAALAFAARAESSRQAPGAQDMLIPIAMDRSFRGRSGIVAGYAAARTTPHRALTGSSWLLVNSAGGAVGVPSLGGSQQGVRFFLQGATAPLALTARISRALRTQESEVSAGYGLRKGSLGLLVERRERLDVKNGAFVVTGYGGAYDIRLPAGLHLDGFAQGGVAGLRQRRWFADGQARVTAGNSLSSQVSVGVGGGVWASAQPGARRVEAGPLVETRLRSGTVGLRVAGEYRFRVTGDANPRSGPALTVGLDF